MRATMPTRRSDSGCTVSSMRIVVPAEVLNSTPLTHTLPNAVMLPTDTSAAPVPPMPPSPPPPPPQATRTAANAPCTSARKLLNFMSGLLGREGYFEAFLEVVNAHAHARARRLRRGIAAAALGKPAVESFQQRLRLGRAELAELGECGHGDLAVHHLALEARVGVPVFDVVVDGLDQVGNVGA